MYKIIKGSRAFQAGRTAKSWRTVVGSESGSTGETERQSKGEWQEMKLTGSMEASSQGLTGWGAHCQFPSF